MAHYPAYIGLSCHPAGGFGGLTTVGIGDLAQKRHSVLRNYPIMAHLRFISKTIRPEMRQYFFESETDGAPSAATAAPWSTSAPRCNSTSGPSARNCRSIPTDSNGCSIRWRPIRQAKEPFRVPVGGPGCAKPYSASVLNISAMSFGALERQRHSRAQWRRKDRRLRP